MLLQIRLYMLQVNNVVLFYFRLENERFDKDFAVADKKKREKEWDQKEQIKEKKRLEGLDREAFKWKRLEDMEKRVKTNDN